MVVFKYNLPVKIGEIGLFVIEMQCDAEPLWVALQDGIPTLWALVDERNAPEKKWFLLAGTGRAIEAHGRFVGTYQAGWFVGHLFEAHRDQVPR